MIEAIGVVVPAADEEDELPGCLAALAVARRHVESLGVSVRIVVVLDGCTDRSAEVVAAAAGVESAVISAGCVGRARAVGAAHLLRDGGDPARLLLVNTDADTLVPEQWLVGMLAEARNGAQLILGTVFPRPGLLPEQVERWRDRHEMTDGHTHVHGANLAIRADAYLALGGWAALASGEDVDLVRRASEAGWVCIARSGGLTVATSARLDGRAPAGYSAYLRDLVADADELTG